MFVLCAFKDEKNDLLWEYLSFFNREVFEYLGLKVFRTEVYGSQFTEMEFDFDPLSDKDSSELPSIRLKFKPSFGCAMALIPISLKDFADLSDLERFRLILNCIEDAVKLIMNKKRGDFEGERMLNDIRNAFEKIKGVKL